MHPNAWDIEGAAAGLAKSYVGDRPPFITDASIKFPVRKNGFEEMRLLRELLFPNYWNCGRITGRNGRKELESRIGEMGRILYAGTSPYVPDKGSAGAIIGKTLSRLPVIRESLKKDAEAAFAGDPAAKSYAEIIRAYPGFAAVMIQRVANVLYRLGVPSYPREMTEQIHSTTGIDIHPGARIGERFFIDHGSGVVIGETAEIGDWVRLYQGVTLGVLHFEKEGDDVLKKGYKRHPTIGSHVVIGAGAKILGPVVIGDHVNIGANSWIEEDVPCHTSVFIHEHPRLAVKRRRTADF